MNETNETDRALADLQLRQELDELRTVLDELRTENALVWNHAAIALQRTGRDNIFPDDQLQAETRRVLALVKLNRHPGTLLGEAMERPPSDIGRIVEATPRDYDMRRELFVRVAALFIHGAATSTIGIPRKEDAVEVAQEIRTVVDIMVDAWSDTPAAVE